MSIWQNFKETDHTFEKKFFKAIIFFALALIVFIILSKLLDRNPEIKTLFVQQSTAKDFLLYRSWAICLFIHCLSRIAQFLGGRDRIQFIGFLTIFSFLGNFLDMLGNMLCMANNQF